MNYSIKNTFRAGILAAVASAALALGCSSTSDNTDGSADDAATDVASDGPQLYGLTPGNLCFDVVSVATGSSDGCDIGVADTVANMGFVGGAVLVNYDMPTATLTVGKAGALGAGTISFNMATLTRANNPVDSMMATCSWHQTDTSQVTLTADNEFDLSATEVQNMFAIACTPSSVPTGGTCTSTWTWHMKAGTKTPPDCN
jgi:hypothetical protein